MLTKIFMILPLLAATVSLAQGPRGPVGVHRPPAASNLDLSKIQTVEGTISAVNVSYGAQYPSIQVNQKLIKVAPAWYLLDQDFELKTGDRVIVTAAPSLTAGDAYLYAIALTNTASGASLTLRDTNGVPLWGGGPGARGNAAALRAGGGCVDPATIASVAGTVNKVTAGAGIQMPTLVIKVPDGKLITMRIGPEWVLMAKDFELNAGEAIAAKYAVASCTGENIALELVNAAGIRLVLRHDDGTPAWN